MRLETSLGHGFYHDVQVSRMVQMAVGEDDGFQIMSFELAFGSLDYTAWPWVYQDFGTTQI
jgi:hypothetical protein